MWHLIMNAVREKSHPVYGYLQHATVIDANDDVVKLSVPKKHFLESLSEAKANALIAGAIEQVSGARPQVKLALGDAPERASAFALAESVLGSELL